MGKRYEKPVSKSLGEVIADAYGNCASGTLAGQACRNGAANTQYKCNPGSVANGACNNGNQALPSCTAGSTPKIVVP